MVQHSIDDLLQTHRDFLLGALARDARGEDRRIATPDSGAEHQSISGDAERVWFDSHQQLAVEVCRSRERLAINDGLLVHGRDRRPSQARLRLALGTTHRAIGAPSAKR